jgi:hypothetical protein
MGEREIGLNIGDQVDGFEVVAAVPDASRPGIWAVAGQRNGAFATWTASRQALDALPVIVRNTQYFTDVVVALRDMLARVRL